MAFSNRILADPLTGELFYWDQRGFASKLPPFDVLANFVDKARRNTTMCPPIRGDPPSSFVFPQVNSPPAPIMRPEIPVVRSETPATPTVRTQPPGVLTSPSIVIIDSTPPENPKRRRLTDTDINNISKYANSAQLKILTDPTELEKTPDERSETWKTTYEDVKEASEDIKKYENWDQMMADLKPFAAEDWEVLSNAEEKVRTWQQRSREWRKTYSRVYHRFKRNQTKK
jgi:hypothetical protein